MDLQGWPDPALVTGHVGNICNENAIVEGLGRFEADAVAALARSRDGAGVVDAKENLVVDDLVQPGGPGLAAADVVHKAIGRIPAAWIVGGLRGSVSTGLTPSGARLGEAPIPF